MPVAHGPCEGTGAGFEVGSGLFALLSAGVPACVLTVVRIAPSCRGRSPGASVNPTTAATEMAFLTGLGRNKTSASTSKCDSPSSVRPAFRNPRARPEKALPEGRRQLQRRTNARDRAAQGGHGHEPAAVYAEETSFVPATSVRAPP